MFHGNSEAEYVRENVTHHKRGQNVQVDEMPFELHVAVIDQSAGRLVVVAVVVATAAKLPPRSQERSNRPCSFRVRYPTKTACRTRTRDLG